MGVDKAQIAQAKEQVEPAIQTMTFLLPTIIMLTALINTLAVWFTSKWIFPKLQIKLPPFPPFAEWKFPAMFLYVAIISITGLYWGTTRGWTEIYELSLNMLVVSALIGLTQGLSLLSWIFNHYKISKFMRRVFYVLIFLNMFFIQLVAITGLIDMLFDYRKKLFKD